MRILVTGGAGFVGSNIVARLCAAGHLVTVDDMFREHDKWRNLASSSLYELVKPDGLADLLQRRDFDVVVHMGAISATTETDVDLIIATNLELSMRLFDICAQRRWRFIYASSAATYGDGSAGFSDDSSADALSRLRPLNAYGWSKAAFDKMVVARRDQGALMPPQWVGLKFFNVFGPNEYHKDDMRSVVHKVHGQIRAGLPVTLFESHRPDVAHGGQSRDFVYVRDCVDIVEWLVEQPAVSGIFNVGSGQSRSFLDLAHAVYAALELQPNIVFVPKPLALRARYQYFTMAEMQRLRSAGYPGQFTPLEVAVTDYVKSYLERENPYL